MVKKKRRNRKPRRSRKKISFSKRWYGPFVLWTIFGFSFILVAYIGYLDYRVTRLFEGKRWSIPARVYASPTELYAGFELTAPGFVKMLERLNYRKDTHLASEATYYRRGHQVFMKTRAFRFSEKKQLSRRIRVTFSNKHLAGLYDLGQKKSLPIFRIDPLHIGSFYPTRKEDRILVRLDDVPDALVRGLLATEDRNFYSHAGISFRSIFRALWANIRAGRIVQGGSTITQQLVKNFFLTPERSLWRKINEGLMAIILDAGYHKDEILEAYLNEIYLGQDRSRAIHGFGLASQYYFGRSLKSLGLEQISVLIALVRGPSYYDPWKHPDRLKKRRNLVLDNMHDAGNITLWQAKLAKSRSLLVNRKKKVAPGRYSSFMGLVRRQLQREYREEDLTSEGLRIFTTLQIDLQDTLERTTQNMLERLERSKRVSQLQAAIVITRREGGEVVAMMGSRDPSYRGFNRALNALRPVGSLIKPVIYLTALDDPGRYTLTTILDDSEIRVRAPNGHIWNPKNYDRIEHGDVSLHSALANSYNLATVRLGLDLGLGRIIKTLRNLGVNREFNYYPSFLLGAGELTPLEITQYFQTLASDGFNTPLRSIRAVLSSDGEPLQRYGLTVRQVSDPAATYLVNTILQESVREGTGKAVYSVLPKTFNVVGKTGTTNDLRDSWFAGFTGDYLGVVWLGRDDNKSIYLSGSSGALRIWTQVMNKISKTGVDLYPPEDIEMVWIDTENGLRGNEGCRYAVQYPFIWGSAPNEFSPCAKSPSGKFGVWLRGFLGNE